MATKASNSAVLLRRICVAFLLVCIFFSVFPHMHTCEESDCFLCVLRELFSENILLAGICFVLPLLLFAYGHLQVFARRLVCCTLVQLKVKLSD